MRGVDATPGECAELRPTLPREQLQPLEPDQARCQIFAMKRGEMKQVTQEAT